MFIKTKISYDYKYNIIWISCNCIYSKQDGYVMDFNTLKKALYLDTLRK